MKLVRVYDANSKLLSKLEKSKKMPDNFDNIYRDEGIVVTFRSPKNEKYYTKELRNLGVYFVATGDVAQVFNEDGKFLGETTIDSKEKTFDIEILLNSIAIETATRLMNGKAKFLNNIPNEVFGGYVHGYDFARMVKEELVNYVTMLASSEELEEAITLCQTEAQNAFGNAGVYIEKYIINPRHIEVQIIADSHGNVVHLGERDCSVQRRHQKLLEEAPSPAIDEETRKAMGAAAVTAAKVIGYEGAGTIEFLLDHDGSWYFMEMNTRIQVEHCVTEMVSSVDLLKEQIRVASGEKLSFTQDDIKLRGHAIECRINAEDADKDFMPCPGEIRGYIAPGGFGVRVDSHSYTGYKIPPYYDSMIGKLICWGVDREDARKRMLRALDEYVITGIKTTIPYHKKILTNEVFISGKFNTGFIPEHMTPKKEEEETAKV